MTVYTTQQRNNAFKLGFLAGLCASVLIGWIFA